MSVHAFHSSVNDQCDPGFHLRSHTVFFDEPECTTQDQHILVTPLSAGIERFLGSHKVPLLGSLGSPEH